MYSSSLATSSHGRNRLGSKRRSPKTIRHHLASASVRGSRAHSVRGSGAGGSPQRSYYDAWRKLPEREARFQTQPQRETRFQAQHGRMLPAATSTVTPGRLRHTAMARNAATAYALQREAATASALAAVDRWATDPSQRARSYRGMYGGGGNGAPPAAASPSMLRLARGAAGPESPNAQLSHCAVDSTASEAERRIAESLNRRSATAAETSTPARAIGTMASAVATSARERRAQRGAAEASDTALGVVGSAAPTPAAAWDDDPPPTAEAAEEDDAPEPEFGDDALAPSSPPVASKRGGKKKKRRKSKRSTTKTKKKGARSAAKAHKAGVSSPRRARSTTSSPPLLERLKEESDGEAEAEKNDESDSDDDPPPPPVDTEDDAEDDDEGDDEGDGEDDADDCDSDDTDSADDSVGDAKGAACGGRDDSGAKQIGGTPRFSPPSSPKGAAAPSYASPRQRGTPALHHVRPRSSSPPQRELSRVPVHRPSSVSPRRGAAPATDSAATRAKDGQKLARQRVLLRLKEKSRAKEEENVAREKVRAERAEREKARAALKVQQRAEIYALNAIMRDWNVRQRAIYLAQQKAKASEAALAEAAASAESSIADAGAKVAEAMQDRSVLSV